MGGVRWGGNRLSQTRPIPRSPDGDNKGGGGLFNTTTSAYHLLAVGIMKRVWVLVT